MEILVPISLGELYDKISILRIKEEKIKDHDKLINIVNELEQLSILNKVWRKHKADGFFYARMKDINEKLWDIEDKIRIKEKNKQYDEEFIQLARSVYFWNDKRAEVKKEINLKYDSDIIEEKQYEKY